MRSLRRIVPRRVLCAVMVCILGIAGPLAAQEQAKKPLDHSVYDDWNRLQGEQIAPDGSWVAYTLAPQDGGDVQLRFQNLRNGTEHVVLNGTAARFTTDSRYIVYLIAPTEEAVKEAREAKLDPVEQPKKRLLILELASGVTIEVDRVRSFELPAESGTVIAYLMEEPLPEETAEPAEAEGEEEAEEPRREGRPGTELVLRRLEDGSEYSFAHVTEYALSESGDLLVYATHTPSGEIDGIYAVETASGAITPLAEGVAEYRSIAISEDGARVAFLTDRDDANGDDPAFNLYLWERGDDSARVVAAAGSPGLPSGWGVSKHGRPSFSKSGRRLYFGTAPLPEQEPEATHGEADTTEADEAEDDEESQVVLDIWHWRDTRLQPQQLLEVDQDRRLNWQAVVHVESGRIVQLADEELPGVRIGAEGDAPLGLAQTSVPYENPFSWEYPSLSDVWLIDVETGERELVMEAVQVRAELSPGGRYLVWWDYGEQHWFARNLNSDTEVALSAPLPHPVHNEIHDTPMPAGPWGSAGWAGNEEYFLIYDACDIWAVDPSGREAARCITEGVGREHGLRFRYVRLDREEETIEPRGRILLSAFDTVTKASGFYRDRVQGRGLPEELVIQDYRFSSPVKAEEAEVVIFTRESFREFGDLWTADLQFRNMQKVSDGNPQQAEYLWGSAELVYWNSLDGVPLSGILYKPEGFDAGRQYPMMVTFYEKNSDNLHQHWIPEPHRSIINYPFYSSRGYLVFIPDIPYRTGYPGESALNAVVPGVNMLVDQGFVDADRIGVAGHSWGGYQIAFMITRTNIFTAAEAGAPVSNMTSAYGGIRWGSGLSRMFQYEWTQSRIGATLWEAPLLYIENSPVFWADKIETPLLIMHNDEDGAVPWEQGIELFVAMRRLQKPCWMIVYNEQPHWPITWPNKKDWAVRLQQYFDHFLLDAPAPRWISEGVPATEKGETLGRELPGEPPPRP